MKTLFTFREFTVCDSHCAMKLTSDAVLLGAVTNPGDAKRILDIGTGCGILALMLAQKSNAIIDAVEIEDESARQAEQNFRESKWHGRINIFQTSIQKYAVECNKKYDCIICNPPYFHGQLTCPDKIKTTAKHNTRLNFEELSGCVSKLLSAKGAFWTIVPLTESKRLLTTFLKAGLFCSQTCHISDKKENEPNRIVVAFSHNPPQQPILKELFLKYQDGKQSEDFKSLTKDFYL
ncbi:MAG: methyltransferase [Bacteroidales bacterium]|jgi:tRNA1Val (adenine37-N6)-methyltransferase|nr:methyltransferase [Bacteroidales bacterium]MDD4213571.1 methyltransferase [Bacteroidales bacterium]